MTESKRGINFTLHDYLVVLACVVVFVFVIKDAVLDSMKYQLVIMPWDRFTTAPVEGVSVGPINEEMARRLIVTGQLIGMTREGVVQLLGQPFDPYAGSIFHVSTDAMTYPIADTTRYLYLNLANGRVSEMNVVDKNGPNWVNLPKPAQ